MNYFPLTPEQHAWQERVAAVAAREIGPRAEEADRAARFPREDQRGHLNRNLRF